MKMHLLKILSIITICFLCLSGQAQTCPGSLGTTVNIASLPYTGTALTTCEAGNEITASNATICGSSSYYGGEDLVFIFTPTTTGSITISLTSSSSWIGMMLYNGCPFTGQGGSCVGNIQNSSGSKTLTVTVTSGVTYYLVVDTWPSPTCIPSFNLSIPAPEGSDPCLSITTLSCGMAFSATPSGTGLWTVTNCGFSTPGQEKIYSFTPTTTGSHSLQVNSVSGGYIDYFFKAASGGCNSSGWTCIDDINLTGTYPIGMLTAGVQYYFLLDPEGTGSYNHDFQIVCPAPVVDPCLSITTLACSTQATVTLSGTGVWNSSTCFFSTPGQEKIYSFTPTVTGVHNIQVTSASGTGYIDYQYKAASGGCSATGWTCIDDINFTGTFSMGTLTAGVQYYILLDAESTTSSSQTFQINCPVAFDPCSNIISLTCGTAATVTLSGTGVWNSSTCLFSTPGQENIFSYTPSVTGLHSMQVTSASGTGYIDYQYKAASGGCSATGWTCIDDINFTGTFSIGMLTAGVQYYILLDAESTTSSTQTFQIVGASLNTYYVDMDGDGFGDPANTTMACYLPAGYVANNTDCDDTNDAINPTATEVCDGIDNDCDTLIDEGLTFTTYYNDGDGDGYGTGVGQSRCTNPGQGFTTLAGDCNDNNIAINPAASEVCDGIDNDCDGLTDEGVMTRYYYDFDGDGYGENGAYQDRCSPSGFYNTTLNGDCNNNDVTIYPNAPELCDGKDNDCDGMTDEGVTTRYYYDFDGDGYGENGAYQDRCSPSGFYNTTLSGDCNNSDNTIYPNAPELCDGKDNDCDGMTDEIYFLPCGWSAEPNGAGCNAGSSVEYNFNTQRFTVTSTNCYYPNSFTSDAMAFAQYDLCGNGSITAQVTSITGTALGWAGVTMRESNAAGAKKAQLMTNLSIFSRREFRTTTNGQAYPQQFPSQNRYWLRITRTGNQFVMYISPNGSTWYPAGAQNISMNSCIEVGLVVTNYTANSTVTATFANVSVTGGAPLRPAIQTGEDVFAAADFSILPNPSNGWIEVDLNSYGERKVQLDMYNLQGKLLRSTTVETNRGKEEIDLSAFSNGMYLIRVRAEGLPDVTKRIVINSNR